MAVQFITTNQTTQQNVTADNAIHLLEGIFITPTSGDGVSTSGGNSRVIIDGHISTEAYGIQLNGDGDEALIGASGTVRSVDNAFYAGVALGQVNQSMVNHGDISGQWGVSFEGSAEDSLFVNYGTISSFSQGSGRGVSFFKPNNTLINHGTITAVTAAIDIEGSLDHNNTIVNSGLITGAIGIDFSSAAITGTTITNSGTILGYDGNAIEFAGDDTLIENSGTLDGDITTSTGAQTIYNSGEILGNVSLGSDADFFDNRGGMVSGTVSGGLGDDIFVVSDDDTVLVEAADEGVDTVKAITNWTLGDNFENLKLIGSGNFRGFGNDLDNIINGNSGDNRINGQGGDDEAVGGLGDDILIGGAGEDKLTGGDGDDTLRGGAEADTLLGNDGSDILRGGAGNDTLRGHNDDDVLMGGHGQDKLYGGDGLDTFIFLKASESTNSSSADKIYDFVRGEDSIDLSGLIDGDLAFIGTSGFSGTEAEVRISYTATQSIIRADVDGDGSADLRINVGGVTDLGVSDLIL